MLAPDCSNPPRPRQATFAASKKVLWEKGKMLTRRRGERGEKRGLPTARSVLECGSLLPLSHRKQIAGHIQQRFPNHCVSVFYPESASELAHSMTCGRSGLSKVRFGFDLSRLQL